VTGYIDETVIGIYFYSESKK